MRKRSAVPREQEHHIQRRIVDLLEAAGAVVVENRSQQMDALATAVLARNNNARKRAKGQVDLIVGIAGGITLWIEVKRPGEDPDADQKAHHQRLVDLGHIVLVIRDESELPYALEHVSQYVAYRVTMLEFARRLRPANG